MLMTVLLGWDAPSYHTTVLQIMPLFHIWNCWLGAHNALAWYTHAAVQPAKLTVPIDDANCLKCHAQVTASRGRSNHFHYFLARWQAVDPNAATCVTCHAGHVTDGDASIAFLNQQHTEAVCQACHNAVGEGGEGD